MRSAEKKFIFPLDETTEIGARIARVGGGGRPRLKRKVLRMATTVTVTVTVETLVCLGFLGGVAVGLLSVAAFGAMSRYFKNLEAGYAARKEVA